MLFSSLNAKAQAGQLFRVTGANGVGKTSLLRIVSGLTMPSEGGVLWNGLNVRSSREEFNRQLVYVGHTAALKADLTPLENLQAACRIGGVVANESAAARALDEAGLRTDRHALSRTLSQGQRHRAGLARLALASGVPLWVLDEPFNALDTTATAWLAGLVARHLEEGGIVVLTSHQGVPLDSSTTQVTVCL